MFDFSMGTEVTVDDLDPLSVYKFAVRANTPTIQGHYGNTKKVTTLQGRKCASW